MEASMRQCPVAACLQRLGTTRTGDPWAFCRKHWHALSAVEQRRLFTVYRSWQRCERAYLKAKADGIAVLKGHMDARALAIREYLEVRDDLVRLLSPADHQLEIAQ